MNLLFSFLYCLSFICCGSDGPLNNDDDNDGGDEGGSSVVTNYLPIADPFILCHNGIYYAYGTSSDNGFEVFHSTDLASWKREKEFALHKDNSWGEKWFWAPEVYYNEANKKFYLYYSVEEHLGVATSDSPLGPFIQDEKKPMLEEKGIDSSLFVDDDGTPYLYFVRFTDGNVIWVAELEKDLKTIKKETMKKCFEVTQVWETSLGRVVEGPSVLKNNGIYYLIYSGNDFRSQNYGVGYATATSPMGSWKKYENNPILQKPTADLVGTGHGAYFTDADGKFKYIFHAHFSNEKVDPRISLITDMNIATDGTMSMQGTIIRPKIIE